MMLVGINMIATIVNMRAPGLTWRRLPIFVWSVLATSVLMVLGAPVLVAALLMVALDRTAEHVVLHRRRRRQPVPVREPVLVLRPPRGVHPRAARVRHRARDPAGLRAQAALGLPARRRRACSASRCSASWSGSTTCSSAGSTRACGPFYMFTTELISIPTGFIFLVAMGTIWRARIRYTVPMLFALAFFFNFLIGGLSGVFLSDVPSDVTLHGSYFVMAHFHYTIMGGLVFAFFAGDLLLAAEDDGVQFNETLAKIHFWSDVRLLQLDVLARCSPPA